jgi:hypothetical protein
MDCLVDHQVKGRARNRVIVGKCPANGGKGLGTKGRVVTLYADRSVKVKENQGITV